MEKEATQSNGNPDNPVSSGSSCLGCLGAVFILGLTAVVFFTACPGQFKPVPGEMNLSMEALQKTFDEIDRVLPDSLIITQELDPYEHYMSTESFGNLYYGLNPVLETAAKADTSRKYKFQYLARVDHVDIDEFEIRLMVVDSIWRHEPFSLENESFFNMDPEE